MVSVHLIVVIISRCICTSNYHIVHFKYIQFYLSIISQLNIYVCVYTHTLRNKSQVKELDLYITTPGDIPSEDL